MKPTDPTQDMNASAWFAQIRSGEVDAASDRRWIEWIAADAGNELAYEQREYAWERAAELGERPAIAALLQQADQLVASARQPGAARARHRQVWPLALAASLAVLAGVTLLLVKRAAVTVSEYATAVGELRVIHLADDSTISLNTGTRLRVSYSRGLRRIDLKAGEAVFAVAKDAARPFEVYALDGVTRAVGTQFDVQLAGETAAVTVLEGTVAVAAGTAGAAAPVAVTAGQSVDYARHGAVSAPRPADAGRIRGWQSNRIVFNNVSLADAIEDYNRYRSTPIVLGDPALGERRVNGVFRVGDEEAFLGALQQGLHVRVVKDADRVVLEPQ